MFTKDRRNAIKELLLENNQINVVRLSTQFGVSEVTIRKDLEHLEHTGFLIRTHGGAVLRKGSGLTDTDQDMSSSESVKKHIQIISSMAANLVQDNELIYLGTDLFCSAIAPLLLDKKRLTVVTNNLHAALELSKSTSVRTIFPGGSINTEDTVCFTSGADTTEYLSRNHYDKAILGVDVINQTTGFALRNEEICSIYRVVLAQSTKKVFCAAGDCFDKNALFRIANLESADVLVSDERMPEAYISLFYQKSCRVYTSYDLENIH